jgi:L-ascorbate metabolism protein UlaG (beta-lactamase superfamily)
MQIEYFGANCVKIGAKNITVVVDDNLAVLGQKPVVKPDNICVLTNPEYIKDVPDGQFLVDRPGEYEVNNVSVKGIAARSHIDEADKKNATLVRLVINDVKIAVAGHIHPDLSEAQLEELGMVDVLVIPVGGNGYTLDGVGALKVIKKIGPKIVIPTHYADSKLKYEVPQTSLEEALKGLAMEPAETLDVLKIKSRDFDEGTKLIVLNRQ